MAQQGNVLIVATNPATQFLAAIVQDAAAYLDLRLPQLLSAGGNCRCRLKGISIVSVENTGWEVWLFRRSRTGVEAIADIQFMGFWAFAAASAVRISAAGLYYQYIDGLDVPYEVTDILGNGQPDNDNQRRNLHIALIARESAKSANAAGAVTVQFILEPTGVW